MDTQSAFREADRSETEANADGLAVVRELENLQDFNSRDDASEQRSSHATFVGKKCNNYTGMIQKNFWVRGLMLLAIALVIALLAIAILLPDTRIRVARVISWLPLQLSLWLLPSPPSGVLVWAVLLTPAFIIGAVAGWLTYNKRWWLGVTGILIVLTIASLLLSAY